MDAATATMKTTSPLDIATSRKNRYRAFIVKKLEGVVRSSFAIYDMLPDEEKADPTTRWFFEAALIDLVLIGTIGCETSGVPYAFYYR